MRRWQRARGCARPLGRGVVAMAIQIHEWVQREWTRAGIDLFHREGDFSNASGLYPDPARRKLRRAPGWAAHTSWASGYASPEGAFYDHANDTVVFALLTTADSHLATLSYDANYTAKSAGDLGLDCAAYGALSGLHQRNIVYWADAVRAITGAGDVYKIPNYASTPISAVWTGSGGETARCLAAYGDTVYLVTSAGRVLRANAALTGFDSYYDPAPGLDVRFAAPFHQYLALVARHDGGQIAIYRLPDNHPIALHQVAELQATAVEPAATPYTDGCSFLAHGDRIYLLSGWYGTHNDLYAFDGSTVTHVAHLSGLPARTATRTAGLLSWRNELLWYAFASADSSHSIQMRVGDGWIDFCPITAGVSSYTAVYSLGGRLLVVGKGGAAEGFYGASGLQDGYLETSWLDFGQPGRYKRLDRLTALADGAHASFTLRLKYRVDGASAWTTAASAANSRRVSADPADVRFHTLQVRVELDDDSGANLDYALEAVSVVYTIDE